MKIVTPVMGAFLLCAAVGTAVAQSGHSELKPIAFSTLDANKDGKISRTEAHADPELYEEFDMLDLNHDGFLTPAEFRAWPRAMKTSDSAPRDPTTTPSGSAGAQHMPPN